MKAGIRRNAAWPALACAVLALSLAASRSGPDHAAAQAADARPNVVLFLTDDQTVADMAVMPRTRTLVGAYGATFERAYISYPLCCPSRATLLTGQYSHNHGVLGNTPPLGGYYRLDEQNTLPVWLQAAGYQTAHIGKLPNGYNGGPDHTTVPPGWRQPEGDFYGYLSGLGGAYVNYHLNENGTVVQYGKRPEDYQTDLYGQKAMEIIDRQFAGGPRQPLYMEMAFFAPHDPSRPADRHTGAFSSAPLPHPRGFEEGSLADKPEWLRAQGPHMSAATIAALTARYRKRLESLQAVDEVVQQVIERLASRGELDNTYVFFMSDNGYFQGQHRIYQGKFLPHEPASHVPLLVRGPGIRPYSRSRELVANVDFVPTVLGLTGAVASKPVDGRSLLPFALRPGKRTRRPLLLESGGTSGFLQGRGIKRRLQTKGVKNLEQDPVTGPRQEIYAPHYRAIRTRRYLLVSYADGSGELYDMLRDSAQLHSRYGDRRYRELQKWLTRKLTRLSACEGQGCRRALRDPPKP